MKVYRWLLMINDSVDNNIGKIIIDSDLSGSDNFEEVG